jgi:CW-type Zinc Finger
MPRQYAAIAPVLNHPGCLKVAKHGRGKELAWKTADAAGDEWFMDNGGLKNREFEKMHEVRKSPKLIIFAHILAKAVADEDKLLVYSKDLATLDIIEWFLSSPDWKKHVHSLRESFPTLKLGGWKKGKDFVRIDGSIESGKRGCLVDKFNNDGQIKVFTISSLAGGIGINLVSLFLRHNLPASRCLCTHTTTLALPSFAFLQCSASVVVIFDNHFNPSISDQCISRAHRLGQGKHVHCYRLAIQGSVESKVYFRSVNKSGVSKQVVDGQFSEKRFSTEELEDLRNNSTLLICQKCLKTRLLPPSQEPPDEDTEWSCEMNQDLLHNSCDIPEAKFKHHGRIQSRAAEDPILRHLLNVVNKATMWKEIVADHLSVEIVHETDVRCEDAIEKLKQAIAGHKQNPGRRSLAGQPKDDKKAKPKEREVELYWAAAKAHGQPNDGNKEQPKARILGERFLAASKARGQPKDEEGKPKGREVEMFRAAAKAHGKPKDDKKAKAREVEIVDLTEDTGSDQETKRYRVTEV